MVYMLNISSMLAPILTWCEVGFFSVMMIHAHRPDSLKRGIIVPIPKGNKDHNDPNNYRGITLMCTLSKLYDKLLLNRHESWILSQLNVLQGISQKSASSLHTTLLLREAIAQQSITYVALLDVKKAFDTVWVKGLLYKLHCMGMNKLLRATIYDSYDNFKCTVSIAGGISNWFSPKQGIHQGDVLSMYLFCLYNNDLVSELVEIPCGVRINNQCVPAPSFVDDISVVAKSIVSMQHYLDTAYAHSLKWKYTFNTDKIKIIVFGVKNKKLYFTIKGKQLSVVDGYKHLGVPLCSSKSAEVKFIEEKVNNLKVACNMIIDLLEVVRVVLLLLVHPRCIGQFLDYCMDVKCGQYVNVICLF